MNNKINNANTEEMKEGKVMQEIDTEALENVAGGGAKDRIKEAFQRIRMSESDKNKMESLLSSYRDSVSGILYLDGQIDASHGNEDYLKRLREEKRKRELTMSSIESELNILAKRFPNISELREFIK